MKSKLKKIERKINRLVNQSVEAEKDKDNLQSLEQVLLTLDVVHMVVVLFLLCDTLT